MVEKTFHYWGLRSVEKTSKDDLISNSFKLNTYENFRCFNS